MRAKVAERGQVTIPKALRKKLGIKSGSILNFEIHRGKLVVAKTGAGDPIIEAYGCLGCVVHTDAFIRELRGE